MCSPAGLMTQGFLAFLNKSVPGLEHVEHIQQCCCVNLEGGDLLG